MAGIPSISTMIAQADSGGTAGWLGTNGIKAILGELNSVVLDRGVKVVELVTDLDILTSADAHIVAVKDVALYVFNAAGITSSSVNNNDRAANGGGRWQYLCSLGARQYREIIGDSTTTAFTINHNLNTLYPTVLQIDTLNSPATYDTTGIVTIVDANNIQVSYTNPPGTQQFTIVVKQ